MRVSNGVYLNGMGGESWRYWRSGNHNLNLFYGQNILSTKEKYNKMEKIDSMYLKENGEGHIGAWREEKEGRIMYL